GRMIGDKMASMRARDMICRGRAPCQRNHHGATLFETAIFVVAPYNALTTRFVQAGVEHKFSTAFGRLHRWHDAPAGDHLREIDDIVLRIAGSHAKRVSFLNFTGDNLL